MTNAVCGIGAVLLYSRSAWIAGALILVGAVLDGIDGKLARKMNATSPLGGWADAVADAISFSLAPAFLMYYQHPGRMSLIAALIYGILILWRLLRFMRTKPEPGTFTGLPSPSAALLVVALILIQSNDGLRNVAETGSLIIGLIAISPIIYPGPGHRVIRHMPKRFKLFLYLPHLVLFSWRPDLAVFSLMTIYLIFGPVLIRRYNSLHATQLLSEGDKNS